MDFFSRMFTSMFRSSANRYKDRAAAQVRRATVGRVQAKAMGAMANLDKKAYHATDNMTGMDKNKNKSGAELANQRKQAASGNVNSGGGAAGGNARAGGGAVGGNARGGGAAGGNMRGGGAAGGIAHGGAAGGGMAHAGNAGGGRASAGLVSAKQQESSKMGKGKRNKRQQALSMSCMNCGSALQPDWDMCPFCGTPVGQLGGPSAPQPMVQGVPQPVDSGEKTMALNLDALNIDQRRTVVGWIVAQNGNHRGEDFRIYDGKNILGTAADCDIVITDPFLSAKHCTIRHENGNFQVTDLDSMNGTFVNQKRVTKSDLIDNDTIRLGRTEFKFKSLF